jgi:protein N-terminal amidase
MGICMDINPKKFEAEWTDYEFASHCVRASATVIVVCMAWLTTLLPRQLLDTPALPDLDTLAYWIERFTPVVLHTKTLQLQQQQRKGILLVLANRCGTEPGVVAGVSQGVDAHGQEVVGYAGTSCVLMIEDGEVKIFEILGKAEERLLRVDTTEVSF